MRLSTTVPARLEQNRSATSCTGARGEEAADAHGHAVDAELVAHREGSGIVGYGKCLSRPLGPAPAPRAGSRTRPRRAAAGTPRRPGSVHGWPCAHGLRQAIGWDHVAPIVELAELRPAHAGEQLDALDQRVQPLRRLAPARPQNKQVNLVAQLVLHVRWVAPAQGSTTTLVLRVVAEEPRCDRRARRLSGPRAGRPA